MKQIVGIGLICVALASCNNQAIETLPSPSIKIELTDGIGSGTKIGENLILTAAHVVQGKEEVDVKNESGAIVKGRVIFVDKERDLALVEAKVNAQVAKIKCDLVVPGTEFTVYGSPMNLEFTYTWGRISSKPRTRGPWQSVYTTDSTILMGNSGGAAFDRYGRIIGVVVGIYIVNLQMSQSVSGLGFVVDGPTICSFLDESKLPYSKR